jgi:hypothetical protein
MFSNPDVRNWVSVVTGAVLACAFAAGDVFYFHRLASEVDLLFFVGGLSALGIHIAWTNGPTTATIVSSTETKGV